MAVRNHLDYPTIQRRLGKSVGWKRDNTLWDADQLLDFDDVLHAGLAKFYYPGRIATDIAAHTWSFLRPTYRFETDGEDREYALPPDFDHILGDITYSDLDLNQYPPIKIITDHKMRSLEFQNDFQSHPVVGSIRVMKTDSQLPQQQVLRLHPIPDVQYTLEFQYMAAPTVISSTNPYPLGGDVHGETIMAAILAEGELQIDDDSSGAHKAEFLSRLRASVILDLRRNPTYFGYNGDNSNLEAGLGRYSRNNLIRDQPVTYNGLPYTSS